LVIMMVLPVFGKDAHSGHHAQAIPQGGSNPIAPPPMPGQKDDGSEVVGAIVRSKVFFVEPKDGATVKSPFKVKMGVEGMKIRKALEDPEDLTTGHHHILVDRGPMKAGEVIPTDAKHIHYGQGQTEVELTLPRGKHTLTLQFADG